MLVNLPNDSEYLLYFGIPIPDGEGRLDDGLEEALAKVFALLELITEGIQEVFIDLAIILHRENFLSKLGSTMMFTELLIILLYLISYLHLLLLTQLLPTADFK